MKISKRLLAVLMAVVMILTIVPLGLFAFAGEEPEPETPEPRTETATIEINSIAELQLIGNDEAYPTAPTKSTATDGAEVTTNYTYKIMKDLSAADENFDAWFADNKELARSTFDKYVEVPAETTFSNEETYYTYDGETAAYVEATDITEFAESVTYYTFSPRDDFETTPLTADEKAKLVEDNSIPSTIDFTPIASLNTVTIDGAYEEGKTATISGLNIKSTTAEDGTIYAGLIADAKSSAIKNIVLDGTCSVKAEGIGTIYVGSIVAYDALSTFDNVKSSAKIDVSNKLYAATSTEDAKNACKTYAGGILGYSILSTVSNSEFSGQVNFTYDSASFTDVNLEDIYKKTTIYIGGIAGYDLVVLDENTKADSAILTSTYLGVGVNAGKLGASNKDYTLLAAYTDDAKTYKKNVTDGYKAADIFGVEATQEPDENGYQLVKATDTESGITYAYIRTPVCGHINAITTHDANAATCAADGNSKYFECSDCGKLFEDEDCTKEIAIADTVISKDGVAHTLGDPVATAKDATCIEAGISYDYYQCSVCNKYFKDAEGTQEVKENDWVVKALGHSWDAGEVTKEPTYDETGTKTYHCTREGCSETKTETIAKLVPPTVTAKSGSGYTVTTTGGKNTIILPNPSTKAGITLASFKSNLKDGYDYVIKNANGKTLSNAEEPIGTNYTVEIRVNGSLYAKTIVIVRGDVDCNGKIGSSDYVKVKKHLRGTNVITDPILSVAADADSKNGIKSGDYIRIKNIMRKK
ncbi:MAG: hypothetical protein Q4E99_02445 [Bacillota bacterium]|nr:hypothetical protein [Bacillota bacterium]